MKRRGENFLNETLMCSHLITTDGNAINVEITTDQYWVYVLMKLGDVAMDIHIDGGEFLLLTAKAGNNGIGFTKPVEGVGGMSSIGKIRNGKPNFYMNAYGETREEMCIETPDVAPLATIALHVDNSLPGVIYRNLMLRGKPDLSRLELSKIIASKVAHGEKLEGLPIAVPRKPEVIKQLSEFSEIMQPYVTVILLINLLELSGYESMMTELKLMEKNIGNLENW
jgi:hypothetical protein